MATLNRTAEGQQKIMVKGAPEVMTRLCDRTAGGQPLDAAQVLAAAESMAADGMRVLGIAEREPKEPTESLSPESLQGLRLLGLAGMIDPPRAEAVAAIGTSQRAGVVVKMVTGDHPVTAKAIGVEIGIASPDSSVVTGAEIERMGPGRLQEVARRTNVWARVEPQHKLRLVQALQARNEVVAMTGDGVNDAPALKQADVGVAMGKTGTAVAKESADIVLTDDNFASIAAAVAEGRRCYDNLVKAVTFAVPTGLGQATVVLLAVLTFPVVGGIPILPILPLQILWVNLVTGVTLAAPLTFEPPEGDLMNRPPRNRDESIFSKELGVRCLVVGGLMAAGTIGLFLYEYYGPPAAFLPTQVVLRRAQTMATTTLVLFQIFYLLECRSSRTTVFGTRFFSSRAIFAGLGLTILLHVMFVQAPFMNATFHTAPLAPSDWLISLAIAVSIIPTISLQKILHKRRAASSASPALQPEGSATAAAASSR